MVERRVGIAEEHCAHKLAAAVDKHGGLVNGSELIALLGRELEYYVVGARNKLVIGIDDSLAHVVPLDLGQGIMRALWHGNVVIGIAAENGQIESEDLNSGDDWIDGRLLIGTEHLHLIEVDAEHIGYVEVADRNAYRLARILGKIEFVIGIGSLCNELLGEHGVAPNVRADADVNSEMLLVPIRILRTDIHTDRAVNCGNLELGGDRPVIGGKCGTAVRSGGQKAVAFIRHIHRCIHAIVKPIPVVAVAVAVNEYPSLFGGIGLEVEACRWRFDAIVSHENTGICSAFHNVCVHGVGFDRTAVCRQKRIPIEGHAFCRVQIAIEEVCLSRFKHNIVIKIVAIGVKRPGPYELIIRVPCDIELLCQLADGHSGKDLFGEAADVGLINNVGRPGQGYLDVVDIELPVIVGVVVTDRNADRLARMSGDIVGQFDPGIGRNALIGSDHVGIAIGGYNVNTECLGKAKQIVLQKEAELRTLIGNNEFRRDRPVIRLQIYSA